MPSISSFTCCKVRIVNRMKLRRRLRKMKDDFLSLELSRIFRKLSSLVKEREKRFTLFPENNSEWKWSHRLSISLETKHWPNHPNRFMILHQWKVIVRWMIEMLPRIWACWDRYSRGCYHVPFQVFSFAKWKRNERSWQGFNEFSCELERRWQFFWNLMELFFIT